MSRTLIVMALVASVVLGTHGAARKYAFICFACAALALASLERWVSFRIAGVSLPLTLSVIMLVTGVLAWMRVHGNVTVGAATVIVVAGALMVLARL